MSNNNGFVLVKVVEISKNLSSVLRYHCPLYEMHEQSFKNIHYFGQIEWILLLGNGYVVKNKMFDLLAFDDSSTINFLSITNMLFFQLFYILAHQSECNKRLLVGKNEKICKEQSFFFSCIFQVIQSWAGGGRGGRQFLQILLQICLEACIKTIVLYIFIIDIPL